MKKIVLNAKDRSYDIYCGSNIYGQIGGYFDLAADKICIITDSNVAPLYLRKIKNAVTHGMIMYLRRGKL